MNPVLFHLYGPIAIHAYGTCIAIGALLAFYLFTQDQKVQKLITPQQVIAVVQCIFAGGYFGGRLLCMVSQHEYVEDIWFLFKFWEPGLSLLGGILGGIATLSIYLYTQKISFLSFFDRLSIYIPLIQSFGRVGCFFTGCCYGAPSNAWYAITYTHENHAAPLYYALHPAQLYSAIMLFATFIFLYFIQQHRTNKAGILACSYLVLISFERFTIDFIRWDRVFPSSIGILQLFSIHQWIALFVCTTATVALFILQNKKD